MVRKTNANLPRDSKVWMAQFQPAAGRCCEYDGCGPLREGMDTATRNASPKWIQCLRWWRRTFAPTQRRDQSQNIGKLDWQKAHAGTDRCAARALENSRTSGP